MPGEGKAKKPRAKPIASTKRSTFSGTSEFATRAKWRGSRRFIRGGRRSGKAQFNWMPTSDLMSRWPVAFFTWAVVIVGVTSVAAAYWYTSAFAPAPISKAHAQRSSVSFLRLRLRRMRARAQTVIR